MTPKVAVGPPTLRVDANMRSDAGRAASIRMDSDRRSDAGLRAGHVDAAPIALVPLPSGPVSPPIPTFTPSQPFLSIDCGQTVEADIVPSSISAFWRIDSPIVANQQYYSRIVMFRVDQPEHVRFILTSTFKSFMTLVRFDKTTYQTTDGTFDIQFDYQNVGPGDIEVTTIDPFTTGHFSLQMICDKPVAKFTLNVSITWPGTLTFQYGQVWGPRVSATPTDNLIFTYTSYVSFASWDVADGGDGIPPKDPPYSWQITEGAVPPGILLNDGEANDYQMGSAPKAYFDALIGEPTTAGDYSFIFSAFALDTGELIATQPQPPATIHVSPPPMLPSMPEPSFFTGLWSYGTGEWHNAYDRRFVLITPDYPLSTPYHDFLTKPFAIAALYAPDDYAGNNVAWFEPALYLLILQDDSVAGDLSQLSLLLVPTTEGTTDWNLRWYKSGPDWTGVYGGRTTVDGSPSDTTPIDPAWLNPPTTITITWGP